MEISPDPRRTMPVFPVTKSHFEMTANFDNFLFEIDRFERCGRTPEYVVLVLMDGDKEISRIKLDIRGDFVRDEKTWNYSLREGVKVQIPSH
jgi:hypothetical protein